MGEGDWDRITPATRAKVWKKRFGFRSTGTCVCCHENSIHRDDFVCGRRRAYAGGGYDVSNLEPICARCSQSMGTHDLVPWCKKFQEELHAVKPMPKTTTQKKTVRRTTAKKPAGKTAGVKKTVRRTVAKKPALRAAAAKKPIRKTTLKKTPAKRSKR
ncbi:MAG TPA: hypothetical protein VMS81_03565 [Methanomicrobiales archaeon]|nr:hypothetical protein [Methanomicrobiales archaeon]